MRDGCCLTDLYLDQNRIGDDGAVALGEALGQGCKLQKLDLGHNAIGNKGGLALAVGMASNRSRALHTLRIVYNKLGDAAGVAFGQAAARSTSLRALYLQHNSFADRAAEARVSAAEANVELTACATDGNALPYQQLLKLEEYLERNRRRLRGAVSTKAEERLRELRETSQTLEQAKEEYTRLSRQRAAAERRVRVVMVELEDARVFLLHPLLHSRDPLIERPHLLHLWLRQLRPSLEGVDAAHECVEEIAVPVNCLGR